MSSMLATAMSASAIASAMRSRGSANWYLRAHTSLDLMQHGIHAKHWCYVGAGAFSAMARVRFSEGLFSGEAFNKTLYVKPDCNVVPATPTPPALTTTLAPTTTPCRRPRRPRRMSSSLSAPSFKQPLHRSRRGAKV